MPFLPSSHQIDDLAGLRFFENDKLIMVSIHAVYFSNTKVSYDLDILDETGKTMTQIHGVNSAFVKYLDGR